MDHLTPIAGLDDLDRHLDALLALPTTTAASQPPPVQIDPALFDAIELQLTDANIPALAPRLLPKVVGVLQNPAAVGPEEAHAAALASLATKLLAPVPFSDALALASEASLVAALNPAAAPATNVLAMTVVHKAAAPGARGSRRWQAQGAAADLARLAAMDGLLSALVVGWLASPSVEVGEKGGRVLGDLLDVDCPRPPVRYRSGAPNQVNGSLSGIATTALSIPPSLRTAPGQGRLWRRLLHGDSDGDNNSSNNTSGLIVALCRGTHPAVAGNAHQQSIAQGRVLRLLPRLAALDLAAVARADEAGAGLLPFAALHMVDRTDVLLHLSLVDFFETLVSVLRVAATAVTEGGTSDDSGSGSVDYAVEVLRTLLRAATADDAVLLRQLQTLPERTVPEEADALRDWLRQLLPPPPTRVAGWE